MHAWIIFSSAKHTQSRIDVLECSSDPVNYSKSFPSFSIQTPVHAWWFKLSWGKKNPKLFSTGLGRYSKGQIDR